MGLIVAGFILYVLYAAGSIFISLDKELKAAFIAGLAAFIVALTTNHIQKRRELDFKIRDRKIEAYQKVFDFLLFFLRSGRPGNDDMSNTELVVSKIHDVNYALLVWGSDLAINAWQEYFRWLSNRDIQNLDRADLTLNLLISRNKLAELIILIRKDLGHTDKNLDVTTIADTYMPLNFTPEDWQMVTDALQKHSQQSQT